MNPSDRLTDILPPVSSREAPFNQPTCLNPLLDPDSDRSVQERSFRYALPESIQLSASLSTKNLVLSQRKALYKLKPAPGHSAQTLSKPPKTFCFQTRTVHSTVHSPDREP